MMPSFDGFLQPVVHTIVSIVENDRLTWPKGLYKKIYARNILFFEIPHLISVTLPAKNTQPFYVTFIVLHSPY